MSELKVAPSEELLDFSLRNHFGEDTKHGEEPTGWWYGAGNPESWVYADELLVPGGNLLDVGIQTGRSSLFFALHGMKVTGYGLSAGELKAVQEMANSLEPATKLDYDLRLADFSEAAVEEGHYDTVLLDHTLNHQPSRAAALAILEKAYIALKPGGHLWVRAPGKESYGYWELLAAAHRGYIMHGHMPMSVPIEIIEDGVIAHPCACSGEEKIEPSLFWDQTELLQWAVFAGAEIVHSQCIPSEGKANVMFGEDYNRGHGPNLIDGTITVIAKKPV